MCSTVPVNNSQSVNSQNCVGVAINWVDVRLCPQLCPQLLYYFMLQVIIDIDFTDFNSKTTVIFILHNNHLLNASIYGPLEDITTINISYNARLEFLELEMPPNSSLETLILSNNNLTTVSPEWFIDTPNLTQISLANNSICKYTVHPIFHCCAQSATRSFSWDRFNKTTTTQLYTRLYNVTGHPKRCLSLNTSFDPYRHFGFLCSESFDHGRIGHWSTSGW